MKTYDNLLQSISIGDVEIKNRFVMLPMTTELVDNYYISDAIVDFYEQRARGGVGLVEIGSVYVSDLFNTTPRYYTTTGAVGAWDDSFISGWKKLTDACHKHGAKVAGQLQMCYEWRANSSEPLRSYAPSKNVASGPFVGMPEREFTTEEIKILVEQYGQAARRIVEGGVDIIEVHAGIGYMVMRFISKYSNQRSDQYGGPVENRARLLTEIIDRIHDLCPNTPILIRTSADDLMPGGNRIEDMLELIPIVESHGIDAWSIQAGFHEAPRPVANSLVPEGSFIHLAKSVKQATELPVFPGTRITSIEMCGRVVDEGYGDMVGMARSFIADPQYVNKVKDGHPELIRSCIVCSRCLDHSFLGKPIQCSVNANVTNYSLGLPENNLAKTKKRIVVVGSGPSALELSRVASIRGHEVILLEKTDRVCGLLSMAQVLNPCMEPYVEYWTKEIMQHPSVDIRLNCEATPQLIESLKPDEVVVAPGGKIISIDVPGIKGKNVVTSQDVKDMVSGRVPEGKGLLWWSAVQAIKAQGASVSFMRAGLKMHVLLGRRLVIVGGGFAGLECASAMAEGRKVTVIEESSKLGNGIGIIDRKPTINAIKEKGVTLSPQTKLVSIKKDGVKVRNLETDNEYDIECDTVLISLGVEENWELYQQIKQVFPHAHLIGDATCEFGSVTRTLEAVDAGYKLGMSL